MKPDEALNLANECKTIEENCLYTATAHYIIEGEMARKARLYKYVPAAASALGGGAILIGQGTIFAWLPIIAGLATAMATALDVDKRTIEHREAAKEYTILRHKARAVYQTFAYEMTREEFIQAVKEICECYNELTKKYPSTTEKAFNEAREKIKKRDYKSDFIAEMKQKEASLSMPPKNKGKEVAKENGR